MESTQIFVLQLVSSVVVFGIVSVWYVWPHLTKLSYSSALVLLLWIQVPRYVGMTLLVPGIVDPNLPMGFLSSAAYGDLLAAALALVSIFALRGRWGFAVPLAWVANTWGLVDALNGGHSLVKFDVPSFNLDTFWYLFTFYGPLVIVSHVMSFWVLLKSKSWKE